MGSVIELQALRKVYARPRKPAVVALDGLSLTVPSGGVFGFLGPNGCGKTTTIRCLLGLAPDFEGTARLFGADVRTGLHTVISRVGAIVEQPALFGGFTARRNLEILATISGLGSAAIDAALKRVGLADRDKELVKGYSLGMRQRLAIAATLLKDPELLILDEPANGLDPAGIREVRQLLRALASEGRTVFVSSHLLSEVQQVADEVAILSKGRSVRQGSVKEVLAGAIPGILLRIDDTAAALKVLQEAGFETSIDDNYLRVVADAGRGSDIARTLAAKNLFPNEMRPADLGLEDVFIALTSTEREVGA